MPAVWRFIVGVSGIRTENGDIDYAPKFFLGIKHVDATQPNRASRLYFFAATRVRGLYHHFYYQPLRLQHCGAFESSCVTLSLHKSLRLYSFPFLRLDRPLALFDAIYKSHAIIKFEILKNTETRYLFKIFFLAKSLGKKQYNLSAQRADEIVSTLNKIRYLEPVFSLSHE